MKVLRQAIVEGSCLLNLSARSMDEVFQKAAEFLVQTGRLPETFRPILIAGLRERELQVPTVIGNACAIPHFYHESLTGPGLVFIRLRQPVNLGAPDGIATRFIFLLAGSRAQAADHLDTLATVARLMSDDEFQFEASHVTSQQALIDALERHVARMQTQIRAMPREVSPGLAAGGRPLAGILADIRRHLPHYGDDFRAGLQPKCAASIVFLFFACLAPAVTFGGIMGLATGGQIGAMEMLLATAVCGSLYALLAGQPLIILGTIGPLLIFTIILYRLCQDLGMGEQFLGVYAWIGLWTALFTVLLGVTNASNLMKYFTRFTDEIFSTLMSLIFIYEAVKAVIATFRHSFADPVGSHDRAFLALLLTIGTFYIASSLARFRQSHYLVGWMREFLADFGPSLALASMAVVAWVLRDEVPLPTLEVGNGFRTTSGRPWLVDLHSVPVAIRWGAAGPALLATVLVFLSQNITTRLVNSPQNKLQHGDAYHLDLTIVGALIGGCSLFGFPWLVAATVRSLAHIRALADVEEVVSPQGTSREQILHVAENRVTALAIHLLIAASLFCLPLLKLIPLATLYGIFLYMGVISLRGIQFVERLSLWTIDSALYPVTHYTRRVPIRVVHLFTLAQFACLVVLCLVNIHPSEAVRILFPIFIALLVPVRGLLNRCFTAEHLAYLDADEVPDNEESHWV